MNRTELKKAIKLAKAYDEEVNATLRTGIEHRKHTEAWYKFTRQYESPFERSLIESVVYDGLRIGLTEKQVSDMLTIAGILKEEE